MIFSTLRHFLPLATAAAAFGIAARSSGADAPGHWSAPRVLCNIADRRVTEASGIVESRRNPGVFYVHNDSGDSARFFAIGRDGSTRFVVNVRNAKNVDWEDIAACRDAAGKPVVFLGDIGDNDRRRKSVTIYEVFDPPAPRGKPVSQVSVAARAIPFRYPDGPHDAETLMAEPRARALYVVTKSWKGEPAEVFQLNPDAKGTQTARTIGEMRFSDGLPVYPDMATGGDISPDGSRLVVRTYQCGYEWTIQKGESVEQAIKAPPVKTLLMLEKQGEAICYGLDGKTLYTTGEQRPTPIHAYEWRTGKADER